MNLVTLYCEDCRVITNLDRSQHVRVGATCEFCGVKNVTCYLWAYSSNRMKRAVKAMQEHIREMRVKSEVPSG